MLHDVVAALAAWPRPSALRAGDQRSVCDRTRASSTISKSFPTPQIPAKPAPSKWPREFCAARGVDSTLVIPADIPLIQADRTRADLRAGSRSKARCSRPPPTDAEPTPPFAAPQICSPCASATTASSRISPPPGPQASHASCCNCPASASTLTIPDDLQRLLAHPGETRTQSLLRRWTLDGVLVAMETLGREAAEANYAARSQAETQNQSGFRSIDPARHPDPSRHRNPTRRFPRRNPSTIRAQKHNFRFEPGDILVVKHKIVSKAEDRIVDLATIKPSAATDSLGRRNTISMPASSNSLCAKAAPSSAARTACSSPRRITASSAPTAAWTFPTSMAAATPCFCPLDPDRSARKLHRELKKRTKLAIPVLITDTFGRPWREGLVDFCIGIAGMKAAARRSRPPRSARLHASRQPRSRRRRTGRCRRAGLRQAQPHPGLHHSRISLRTSPRPHPRLASPCNK